VLLVVVASFKAQVSSTIEGQFKGDFFVTAKGNGLGFSPAVAKAVAKVAGVVAVTPVRFYFGDLKLVDAGGGEADSSLIAVDTSTVLQTVDIPVEAGSITKMTTGTVAIGNDLADKYHWKVGDAITMKLRGDSTTPLTIAAIVDAKKVAGLFQGASAIVGIDTFEPIDPLKLDQLVYVRTDDTGRTRTAALKQQLSDAVKAYPSVEIGDLASYKKLVDDQVAPFVRFLLALLSISVFIATVGVANTMKLSIAERTRELGVLRAVGMHRRQAKGMVRWEAITISVFGVVIGSLLGGGFGVAVMRSLKSQGFTESVVPYGQFVVMAIVAALLGLLAASGAARRVSRLNVLQAISVQ
jgi:putative ABC transport system permease protein